MSATCSYLSLAQLEDAITPDQTGNFVENIRYRRRDALSRRREQERDERLKDLRESFKRVEFLVQHDAYDSDSDDDHSVTSPDFSSPWSDPQSGLDAWNAASDTNSTPNPQCRPSPSRSPYSTCSTATTAYADEVDGPSISVNMMRRSQNMKKPKPRISIKDCHQRRSIDKVAMKLHDQEGLTRDYMSVIKSIQEEAKNLKSVQNYMNSNWRIVLRPFFSEHEHIRTDMLHLLTSAVIHNIIQPDTMLNMLSHGLMQGTTRILADIGGPRRVTNFILAVHKSMNPIFPYLIDMASGAGLFATYADIAQASETDLESLLDLYIALLPIYIDKITSCASEQPLIAGLSAQSRLSEATLNYYGPMSTAMKMIPPTLVHTITVPLLLYYKEPKFVYRMLFVLSNIVQLTYLRMSRNCGNVFSVFPLLGVFDSAGVDDNVSFLIKYYGEQLKQSTSATPELEQIINDLAHFKVNYNKWSDAFDSFQHQYRRHIGMQP